MRRTDDLGSGCRRLALLVGLAAVQPTPAGAAAAPDQSGDDRLDLAVTLGGAAFWLGTEAAKADLAGSACRWCDRGEGGLNPVDANVRRALKWHDPDAADRASSLVAYGVAPLSAFGMTALAVGADRPAPLRSAALVVAEAVVLTADLHQVVKFTARRERPYTRFGSAGGAERADDHLSFYSAHTDTAFAFASASTMVAYELESPWTTAAAATGFGLATAVGYLRIAADRHYFSDVLTGAVTGSLIGAYVPWLHVHPGVWRVAGMPVQVRPAVLATGPAAVATLTW